MEARRRPSGLNATDVTEPVWPRTRFLRRDDVPELDRSLSAAGKAAAVGLKGDEMDHAGVCRRGSVMSEPERALQSRHGAVDATRGKATAVGAVSDGPVPAACAHFKVRSSWPDAAYQRRTVASLPARATWRPSGLWRATGPAPLPSALEVPTAPPEAASHSLTVPSWLAEASPCPWTVSPSIHPLQISAQSADLPDRIGIPKLIVSSEPADERLPWGWSARTRHSRHVHDQVRIDGPEASQSRTVLAKPSAVAMLRPSGPYATETICLIGPSGTGSTGPSRRPRS